MSQAADVGITIEISCEEKCLLCHRPARARSWTCENCHDRICREAALDMGGPAALLEGLSMIQKLDPVPNTSEASPRSLDRSPVEVRLDELEQRAVEAIKDAGHLLGSKDANDTGPAICAVWNLGAEARRLARIVERGRRALESA